MSKFNKKLLSPCGDKLKSAKARKNACRNRRFPSPCGDKLKSPELDNACAYVLFPSPCGDKLKCTAQATTARLSSFRPLAGIS